MPVKTDLDLDSHPLVPRRRAVTVLSKPTALAAGTALILAAAGCGGGGKSSNANANASATPATPTMAEYVAKANAICSASNGSLNATVIKLAGDPNPVDAAHIVSGSFIPQIKSQLSQIQAIGTPAGGKAAVAAMDHLLAGDIAKIEKDPALAGPAAFDDFAKVAHGYGLTDCAPLS
jgi:hypothetical protein